MSGKENKKEDGKWIRYLSHSWMVGYEDTLPCPFYLFKSISITHHPSFAMSTRWVGKSNTWEKMKSKSIKWWEG